MEYRPLEETQVSKLRKPLKFVFDNVFKLLFLVVIIVVVVMVFIFIKKHSRAANTERDGKDTSIKCFECLYYHGFNWTYPPLPFETDCELRPKNERLCRKDEICHFGKMTSGTKIRIQRSCYKEKRQLNKRDLGCVSDSANGSSKIWCFCETNLCKS